MTTATRWWHRQGDQIACDLCPRECALHEGQRGFCFVRQNVGGEMVLTTYGRSSGFCIDPIEKKPLNHFLPGTPVLSFGTAGCNLGCKFCQNWSISKSREIEQLSDDASPEEIARAAKNAGCRSVAFTYNDPVIWAEYAIDTARACHDLGLKTVAVTAGYISPAARKDFYDVMDAANVDLKAFSETFYKHVTLSKLEPVLDTLRWLKHESDVWFEITNLMIPGENDSADETARMCDWIVENVGDEVPVHFTAFHPDFRMQDHPPTPPETLHRARGQAVQAGIKYPYVGNVHDVAGQSTYCPNCKTLLIERDWYELGEYRLQGNRCENCQAVIPGLFDDQPGDWGRKRMPIRISRISKPVVPPVIIPAPPQVVQISPAALPAPSPAPALKPISLLKKGDRHLASGVFPNEDRLGSEPVPLFQQAAMEQSPQTPVVNFSDTEISRIMAHARAVAEAALLQSPLPQLHADLASAPTYGLFVTFRRGTTLRACRGRFGEVGPLGDILNHAVRDSVLNDPRFPPIIAAELPQLHIEVSLMFNPRPIASRGEQRAEEVRVGRHGLVINHPQGRGLLLPQVATAARWDAVAFLKAVSGKAGLPQNAWCEDAAQVMTFEARVIESAAPFPVAPVSASPVPELDARPLTPAMPVRPAETVRPAARSGQFYPGNPAAVAEAVTRYLAEGTGTPERYRAVMLPHAGWAYCGSVIGRTLARVEVPRTVIAIGPKHTPHGANWSVSSADTWEIPGASIPVAGEIRARLLGLVRGLASESDAHRQEHAIEVLLPFLHRRNPDLRIVPLVLGPTSYSQTQLLARALAIVASESAEPPLFVISSDMNHFAPEPENRRRDQLALQAMQSGDPVRLFDTVQAHQISMCGVIPAIVVMRALREANAELHPQLVHYTNSGEVSGDLSRVVGYAGMLLR